MYEYSSWKSVRVKNIKRYQTSTNAHHIFRSVLSLRRISPYVTHVNVTPKVPVPIIQAFHCVCPADKDLLFNIKLPLIYGFWRMHLQIHQALTESVKFIKGYRPYSFIYARYCQHHYIHGGYPTCICVCFNRYIKTYTLVYLEGISRHAISFAMLTDDYRYESTHIHNHLYNCIDPQSETPANLVIRHFLATKLI